MFRRKRNAGDFGAEINAHIELETERLQEQGLSYADARTVARRAFGNVTQAQERFYESRHWVGWDHFRHDLRFTLRMLRKSPGFTAIAVLTIALGIGATTAIFSVVDATLLHPLPYPHPEQLVSVVDDLRGAGAQDAGLSQPELQDLQHSGIFQYVSPDWYDDNNLTGSAQPARVRLMSVAPSYFAVVGVKPQVGRTFNPEDSRLGYIGEVVISDGLWQRAFARDARILDRSLRLDTDLYRIVGVMPAGFHAPGDTVAERNVDVWAACNFNGPPLPYHPPRNVRNIPGAIARLKPGLTLVAAQSRLNAFVASLQQQYPVDYPRQNAWTVRLVPLKETVVGNVRQPLMLLLGAVGLVLLIVCVNVANLLLARASTRGREIAVRQALGAASARLMWQLLTESLILALLGGMAGLAILFSTKSLLLRLVPDSLPQLTQISINWGVLVFALVVSLAAGVIFGLAPALHARQVDLTHALKEAPRGSTGSGEQSRTRRVLVITEVALSLVLMVAASLLLRSFWDLLNERLGFNPESVMVVRTRLPYPNDVTIDKYKTTSQEAPFIRELLRRGRTLPGVKQVALGNSTSIPLDHPERDQNLLRLVLEGPDRQSSDARLVEGSIVTPEYFPLMGLQLLRGRLFSDFDNETAAAVVVINEAMAQTYWPNEEALGKHLKLSPSATTWATVVGVVANARTESLADGRVPLIYVSLYQRVAKHLAVFLRGQLDPAAIPGEVREQVRSVDPTLPVFGAQKLDETVSASLSERRFSMEIVGLFALTALLLAGLGVYGVISYAVSERTHEIGIRLALGAQKTAILRMVLRQGLSLAFAGAAVGVAGALIVGHLMAGLLYGVQPRDPLTFTVVTLLLIGAALLACYFPARRAVHVDPMVALRYE